MNSLVSIIVRAYNLENFIAECIDSILIQDYQNLQIIVIDDCSTDETAKIIKTYAKKHPDKIEAIFNKENMGHHLTFNIAFKKVMGKFFTVLDGDDIYLPGKISMQVNYLKNNDCAGCFNDAFIFQDNVDDKKFLWSERFEIKEGTIQNIARYGHFPISHSIMFNTKYLPKGGYEPGIYRGSDWYFLLNTLNISGKKINYIDKVNSGYRKQSENVSISSDWGKKLASQIEVVASAQDKFPKVKHLLLKYQAELYFIEFLYFIKTKYTFKAIKSLFLSLVVSFPNPLILLRIPFREVKFYFKQGRKIDPYIRSFFN